LIEILLQEFLLLIPGKNLDQLSAGHQKACRKRSGLKLVGQGRIKIHVYLADDNLRSEDFSQGIQG